MARPTLYSPELVEEICRRISEGESLRSVCADEAMPSKTTVCRWLAAEENAAFRDQYARAREALADHYAEEMLEIADRAERDWTYDKESGDLKVDGEHIQRAKLMVDTRKWAASKLAPKKYGDKLTNEHVNPDGSALSFTVQLVPARKDES